MPIIQQISRMITLALHRLWGLCSDELYDPFSQRPQRLPLPFGHSHSLILPVPCPTFGEHFMPLTNNLSANNESKGTRHQSHKTTPKDSG